jgi:hypothetical protein
MSSNRSIGGKRLRKIRLFSVAARGYSGPQLKGAPKFSKYENFDWSDRARGREVYDYYGVTPLSGS